MPASQPQSNQMRGDPESRRDSIAALSGGDTEFPCLSNPLIHGYFVCRRLATLKRVNTPIPAVTDDAKKGGCARGCFPL